MFEARRVRAERLVAGFAMACVGWAAVRPAAALDIPPLEARVNDYAALLSSAERGALEAKLDAYEAQSGHQFTLLTVPTLDGQAIEDFGIKVAERWKLGDAKRDDGLILIIAVKDRRMRVEVGHGLEGDVPDAISARVLREVLTPAFRAGAYAQGIDDAFNALILAASGEAPPAARPRQRTKVVGHLSPIVIPIVLFILFSLLGGGGRRRRRGFFVGPFIGGGGGWGGGGGGGWGGGGGGGGGGFSGGGGSFGGGGASGSW